MAENGIERRRYRRVDARVQVSIQKHMTDEDNFSSEDAVMRNLSAGGLLVHHDRPVEIPSYIIVSFSLPDSQERLDFVAKVIRIEELLDGTYELGIMFMRMIMGGFEEIEKFISAELDAS